MSRYYVTGRWKPSRKKYEAVKTQAVSYKGGKCQDCHGEFPNSVFEFAHKDPFMKVMAISAMIHLGLKLGDLKSELDKCDLLCANCHRIRHESSTMKKVVSEKISFGLSLKA